MSTTLNTFIQTEIGLKKFFITDKGNGMFAIYKKATDKKPSFYVETLETGFNYFKA